MSTSTEVVSSVQTADIGPATEICIDARLTLESLMEIIVPQPPRPEDAYSEENIIRRKLLLGYMRLDPPEPRMHARLMDLMTFRIGTFTGEILTSFPGHYRVVWEDDQTAGTIWAPLAWVMSDGV